MTDSTPTSTAAQATITLLIGPVGAGKTTFATKLCREQSDVFFNLDQWMAELYGKDQRPEAGRIQWYLERRDRCLRQQWLIARQVLAAGTSVVLEVGLVRKDERTAFYEQLDETDHPLTVYLLDAPRAVRRERVAERNERKGISYAMEVPMPFFEIASDAWEPPDEAETRERNIKQAAAGT